MSYPISSDMLHAAVCLIYIFSGIFCGVVRWFHMCHPYDMNGDYFYPARKGISIFCVSLIVLLPYVLQVDDNDTWLYARSFGIIYYPVLTSWMMLRYFKGKLTYKGFSKSLLPIISMLILAMLLCGTTDRLNPSSFAGLPYIIGGWGCVLCAYLLNVTLWLKKRIDHYHHDCYSSEADFPYRFAKNVFFTPVLILLLMWFVFISDSRDAKMWADVIMTIYNIGFLCVILHPQRRPLSESQNEVIDQIEKTEIDRLKQETECELKSAGGKPKSKLSAEQKERLIKMIEREIRDNKAFFDKHYNLAKLAQSIHVGRTYTSLACTELGGFYYIVNKYRLEYVEHYSAGHPEMDQEEIALTAGFTDKRAYRNALKSLCSSQHIEQSL